MSFQLYLKELQKNQGFLDFMKENPQAYLCSCFFTIDKEGEDNKQHLDFFVPEKDKVFSFQMENSAKMMPLDSLGKAPEKLPQDFDIDFSKVEERIKTKMRSQEINNRVQKLIFALQKMDGKEVLMGTVFLSMFGLLKVSIDIRKREIIEFEKKSFFDMINIFKKS